MGMGVPPPSQCALPTNFFDTLCTEFTFCEQLGDFKLEMNFTIYGKFLSQNKLKICKKKWEKDHFSFHYK